MPISTQRKNEVWQDFLMRLHVLICFTAAVLITALAATAQDVGSTSSRRVPNVGAMVAAGDPSIYTATQLHPEGIFPIDLATAWQLAARRNPTIGWTQQIVQERLAALHQARVIALPSFNAGSTLHTHNGSVQTPDGTILMVPGQASLYAGGGAGPLAAGTVTVPAVSIFAPVANVFYEPLAARQLFAASQFDVRATFNEILLESSTQYLELVGAQAWFDALRQSEFEMAEIVRPTLGFAQSGQGRESDANRARSEAILLRARLQGAEGDISVASARLCRLLQLNPSVVLRAPERQLAIVTLVDPERELESLVQLALRFRPEMGARTSEVAAAEVRYRQERMRPLLPTVATGFSAGTFGGGSALTMPTYGNFSGRSDFDIMALWTLQNSGFGNVALWRRRRAEAGEANAERIRTLNQIREEVAAARADATARRQEVDFATRQLQTAEFGFLAEVRRARGGEGLPIEALNLMDLLIAARRDLIRATVAYDQAQFRLFVALGWPPNLAVPVAPSTTVWTQNLHPASSRPD